MTQRTLDRLWNRLVDRYGQEKGADFGCGSADELPTESAGEHTDIDD